jgi:hypothetical protein
LAHWCGITAPRRFNAPLSTGQVQVSMAPLLGSDSTSQGSAG